MPSCRRSFPLLFVAVVSLAAADVTNLIKAGTQAVKKSRFEEAVGLFTEAIATNPQSAEAYSRRGQAYAALNRADEAIKDMAAAIKLEPAERNHLLDSARVYDTLNRIPDAVKECTRAIEMKKEPNALQLRAQLYARAGKYAEAVADYTDMLLFQPSRADLYIARAQLYRLLGHATEAGQDFGKAIRLNPTYSTTVNRLLAEPPTRSTIARPTLAQITPAPAATVPGAAAAPPAPTPAKTTADAAATPSATTAPETRVMAKKTEPRPAPAAPPAAVTAATPAVASPVQPRQAAQPEAPKPDPAAAGLGAEAQQVTAALSSGRAQLDAKQWAEAIKTYTTVIELRPKHAEAWLRRCMANQLAGNNKAAIADCTKALELHTNADTFYYRARAYHSEKDLHRAITDYSNSILVKPFNPDAHFYRAQVWQSLDNLSGAIYGYSEAARQKQGFTEAILARAELRLFLGDKTGYQQDLELAKPAARK
ncbi:MAG TPA: tetratricopeptide repeat protein [Bryobacteraceae bacterium]|nr:tetratricopeptide repeat protein [Bryobacteraceae bacterium]